MGLPPNHVRIEDLGAEILALQIVQSRHELNGDQVARREVQARLSAVRANLEEQLREAVTQAKWVAGENEIESGVRLAKLASDFADRVFHDAPRLWSELVNRENPSSNSVKARRDLLYRVLDSEDTENLGIEGYPAERGLYATLLGGGSGPGLHRQDVQGVWRIMPPDAKHAPTFVNLWEATRAMFVDANTRVNVADIQAVWASPPFGVRKGVMPVIFSAFLMAHKANLALYKNNIFIPRVTDADLVTWGPFKFTVTGFKIGQRVRIYFRPHDVYVSSVAETLQVKGRIASTRFRGPLIELALEIGENKQVLAHVPKGVALASGFKDGQTVFIGITAFHVFPIA